MSRDIKKQQEYLRKKKKRTLKRKAIIAFHREIPKEVKHSLASHFMGSLWGAPIYIPAHPRTTHAQIKRAARKRNNIRKHGR